MKSIITAAILAAVSTGAAAHSGGTDLSGGHYDSSDGAYHEHNSGRPGNTSTPPYVPFCVKAGCPTLSEEDIKRIADEYFEMTHPYGPGIDMIRVKEMIADRVNSRKHGW